MLVSVMNVKMNQEMYQTKKRAVVRMASSSSPRLVLDGTGLNVTIRHSRTYKNAVRGRSKWWLRKMTLGIRMLSAPGEILSSVLEVNQTFFSKVKDGRFVKGRNLWNGGIFCERDVICILSVSI